MMRSIKRHLALAALCASLWPIPLLAQPPDAPARIILIVDSSVSMAPHVNDFRAGLLAFLNTLPEGYGDEVALVTTGGQMQVRVPPTTDRRKLKEAVGRLGPENSGNAFVDALAECEHRFLRGPLDRWPVFVILTPDLVPTRGHFDLHGFNRLVKNLADRRGSVHAVVVRNLETRLTTELAQNLVTNTRGVYESMFLTSSLPEKMERIADTIYADHHPRRPF